MFHEVNVFGHTPEGDVVERHTLRTRAGLAVSILTFGGRLCELRLPDRRGDVSDILLGFDNLDAYVKDTAYFGAIIGRYAIESPRVASASTDANTNCLSIIRIGRFMAANADLTTGSGARPGCPCKHAPAHPRRPTFCPGFPRHAASGRDLPRGRALHVAHRL